MGRIWSATDGTTLMGADDKGPAWLHTQAVEELMAEKGVPMARSPGLPAGRRGDRTGCHNFMMQGFGADFAYTLTARYHGL